MGVMQGKNIETMMWVLLLVTSYQHKKFTFFNYFEKLPIIDGRKKACRFLSAYCFPEIKSSTHIVFKLSMPLYITMVGDIYFGLKQLLYKIIEL